MDSRRYNRRGDTMLRIDFATPMPLRMAGRFAESGGWTHSGRMLDRNILCYIEDGRCSFVIDGKTLTIASGEAVIIPHDTFYAPHTEDGCLYQYFHFCAEVSETADDAPLARSYRYREEMAPASAVFHLPKHFAVDADMRLCLESALHEMSQSDPMSNLRMNLAFLEALAQVAEKNAAQPERTLAFEIERFIRRERKPTLSLLSERFGYTKQYIIRIFKRQFSQTPAAYINEIKLARAARYLTETGASVETAAHQCGFEDSNYFSRQFKRKYGLTPTEYRKQSSGI